MTGPKKRLTNNAYLVQSLGLQTRQLALKREKVRLARRKVEAIEMMAADQRRQAVAMENIANELIAFRTVFASAHGFSVDSFEVLVNPVSEI